MADKVAIVTGAASGIGAATMAELRSRGWKVAGFDLKPATSDCDCVVDVSNIDSVADAVKTVQGTLGLIDAVVSAAGHYEIIPIADIDQPTWTRMLHVHLGGAFNLAREVLPSMVQRKTGSIVFVTSELAIGGGDQDSHYASAKGAIIGLIRSLAAEMAPHGIRVNGVAPGPTDTPLLSADSPWRDPQYLSTLPSRGLCKPEEVALIAGFLVDEGTFAVGEIISPNSGAVI